MTTRDEIENGVGIAMLVMIRPTADGDPATMWERLTESDTILDPHAAAYRLWESVKADWPGHEMSVIQNKRSHYLMWSNRMRRILSDDAGSIDDYLSSRDG